MLDKLVNKDVKVNSNSTLEKIRLELGLKKVKTVRERYNDSSKEARSEFRRRLEIQKYGNIRKKEGRAVRLLVIFKKFIKKND